MGYDWRHDPDGDYEQVGDGPGIRLIQPTVDYHGHPIVGSSGFAKCPRCPRRTNIWWCKDPRCDGVRTSRAHERDCPRSGLAEESRHDRA